MNPSKAPKPSANFALFLAIASSVAATATPTFGGEAMKGAALTSKPTIVYVADFELDPANLKTDTAAPPAPPKLPGFLAKVLPPPPGSPKEPEELARELRDLMSKSLIKELVKAGLDARRIALDALLPVSGLLVRGEFTRVDQGNQVERAVVGLGKGRTDLQVRVDIVDIAQGASAQIDKVNAAAGSGKTPGAASMIDRHPAAAAARFVLAGNDLKKNVKQTATQIAAEVVAKTSTP